MLGGILSVDTGERNVCQQSTTPHRQMFPGHSLPFDPRTGVGLDTLRRDLAISGRRALLHHRRSLSSSYLGGK
jgi:hypothetical protein